jgi:hypothetical protein
MEFLHHKQVSGKEVVTRVKIVGVGKMLRAWGNCNNNDTLVYVST